MTNPMTLTRTEMIHELRGHTTKRELDKLVKLPTAEIRAALAYTLSSEAEKLDERPDKDEYERFGQPAKRSYKKGEVMFIAIGF